MCSVAEWVSWGAVKGAEKIGDLIRYGSAKLRENTSPESNPSQIDERARQGVRIARRATDGAIKVSGFLGQSPCTNIC